MFKMAHSATRVEKRIPMAVAVQISGHAVQPGTEMTFTENVSAHGARVLSSRRWKPDDRLSIRTLTGNFEANARVAWCAAARGEGFAVGLELLNPSGEWVVRPPAGRAGFTAP